MSTDEIKLQASHHEGGYPTLEADDKDGMVTGYHAPEVPSGRGDSATKPGAAMKEVANVCLAPTKRDRVRQAET